MANLSTILTIVTIIATFAIALATAWTLKKDIRTRLRIRHTDDIREQVLEPWLSNPPTYGASSPRGPDGGNESLLASLIGFGFTPYPDEVSLTLLEHFTEYHLDDDAPHDLDELLDEIESKVRVIRDEKRAYLNEISESEQMEQMLSEINKDWAEVDQKLLTIWLREVFVSEYTGGHFMGETLWMDPKITPNGLRVKERDGEYQYYPLTEKKRERQPVTNAPVITSQTEVPEIEVEKLLHRYKRHAEYNFGHSDYNEHIMYAGEAMQTLISEHYRELDETLQYYSSLPVLPNDCYSISRYTPLKVFNRIRSLL